MGNRFGNVNLYSRLAEPGRTIVLPTAKRVFLGYNQFSCSILSANQTVTLPAIGNTGQWQYSPQSTPVSIAAIQIYFVAAVNAAGSLTFTLKKNISVQSCPSAVLGTGQNLYSMQTFQVNDYRSDSIADFWWLYAAASSNYSAGTGKITFGVWIYDGIT